MLELDGINYWAILVTWLIYVTIGAWWYSPAGFGRRWAKLSGVNHMKIPEKEATRIISFVALSAAVQAFVLALIINSLNVSTVLNGVLLGLALWLGFTAATSVGNTLYQRLGWKFWWLNNSYFLLAMVVGAAILAIWR